MTTPITAQIDAREQLAQQPPLTLVVGAAGSGKSQFLSQARNNAGQHQQTLFLKGLNTTKPQQVLLSLCDQAQLLPPSKSLTFNKQLLCCLQQLQQNKQSILFIIDDAHELPFGVLAAVAVLTLHQQSQHTSVQFLLSGQPDITQKMNQLNLNGFPILSLPFHVSPTPLPRFSLRTYIKRCCHNSTLSIFWIHHQVKIISTTALLTLSALIWPLHKHLSQAPAHVATHNAHPHIEYKLRVFSSGQRQTIDRFIHSHQLQQLSEIEWTLDKGKTRFFVDIGHYSTYNQALHARQQLPEALQQQHPDVITRWS